MRDEIAHFWAYELPPLLRILAHSPELHSLSQARKTPSARSRNNYIDYMINKDNAAQRIAIAFRFGSREGPGTLQSDGVERSEEQTYELQSLMRISHAVFCLTQQQNKTKHS